MSIDNHAINTSEIVNTNTVIQIRKTLRWNRVRVRLLLATAVIAILIAGRALAQFEGIVESRNITADEMGKPQEFIMTMFIKKDMVRIETKSSSMPSSTMIYRTDMKKIFMLNNEEKTYFEIAQDEKAEEFIGSGGTSAKYSVKKTGKTRMIAGYLCEQFIIKRENEETELWGTKKLDHLLKSISKALGQEHMSVAEGAGAEVMKMGIYPMHSVTKVDGHLIESQEITRVEAKRLEMKTFELPAGYKKQKGIDMMQGMQEK